ncbi:MAG: RluA family pseudouridine synthase [Lachnospiraceae bacterium]|nr:RluA family pseudouridine synthase [Lachnospiraceae bacterium]
MILYEDKEILVCHKPTGIPVQSASVREKDLVSILRNHLGSDVYVVHRLDQPVEGVLVFAKTKHSAAALSRQITDGSMRKIYHAVAEVSAHAEPAILSESETDRSAGTAPWHTLINYLAKDGRNNTSFVSKKDAKDAKRAELRYQILKYKADDRISSCKNTPSPEDSARKSTPESSTPKSSAPEAARTGLALAKIELLTGRHHQIRVQMAHAGLPLAGDRKYNPNKVTSPSLALCAVSLTFRHPANGKTVTFEVQPQADVFALFIPD